MNDLEQLREDIRATAPEPRPQFEARLERRVEAGFRTSKPEKPPRQIKLWGPAAALACTALVAVVVGIGLSGGGDDEAMELGSEGGSSAEVAPQSDDAAGDASRAPAPLPRSRDFNGSALAYGDGAAERRRVVEQRTSLELEAGADEFTDVSDGVLRVADDTNAIVLRSSVSERDRRGLARFDLRVPASRLDEAMAELSRLAHVTSRRAATEDITGAYVSAADRLKDARAERRALLKALEKADTENEAEALRQQIRFARDRIVAAQRDVTRLQRRADRARVSVTVRSTGRKAAGAWTPGDAIDDAGRILEVAVGVVVVTAAALAPVALLVLLGALAARTVRRRRREAALDAG